MNAEYLRDPIIARYRTYLLLERSYSNNTEVSYIEDLSKFLNYLADAKIGYLDVTLDVLRDFLIELNDLGISQRSTARIISGIRSFYKFLLMENLLNDDPTELLESPKLARKLPDVLSLQEINEIIDGIDVSDCLGQRNRAILETLYSCGLRVSELVDLRISKTYPSEQYLVVIGKGNKQRIVPMSPKCIKEIQLWTEYRSNMKIQKGSEDHVFINRRGAKMTRNMVFYIVKDAVEKAGIEKTVSPHTFRHSFATHLLEGGANLRAIQEMLGHESILTTEIYTHIDTQRMREEILMCHPRNIKK